MKWQGDNINFFQRCILYQGPPALDQRKGATMPFLTNTLSHEADLSLMNDVIGTKHW